MDGGICQMNLLLINLFSNILDTLLVFYYLVVTLDKKEINLKKASLLLTVLVIINTIINTSFGSANFFGFLIILTISTIFYSYVLYEPFADLIIHCLSATLLMGIIEVISVTIISLLFNVLPSVLLEVNGYRVLAIILSKFILFLTIKYLIKKVKFPDLSTFRINMSLVLIFLFNVFVIFMTFTIYKYLKEQTFVAHLHLVGLGLGVIIFNWVIYNTTKESMYRSQQEIIWKMKEEEFYKSNFYIDNMKEILQSIRAQRHELNNYLSTLYGLIYMQNYEKAKEYITKINDKMSILNSIIETNNPVTTAIVSIQKNKAFNEGINMEINIDDLPEELPFDPVDLSIIIGNLLNNAREACMKLEDEKPRAIKFYMGIKDENLIIEVINTKSDLIKLDVKEIIGRFTTKKDKENHGFGLRNVNFIVNQYNGTLDLKDLGNEFWVYISLPVNRDLFNEVRLPTIL